jgi:hypothetical protein
VQNQLTTETQSGPSVSLPGLMDLIIWQRDIGHSHGLRGGPTIRHMVRDPKLLWIDKVYFRGWGCDGCNWRLVVRVGGRSAHATAAEERFAHHDCAQFQDVCPDALLLDPPYAYLS